METPKTQDWVKARAECSLDHLFIALTAVVEADTEAANLRSDEDLEFKIRKATTDGFLVVRTFNAGGILESEAIAFDRKRDAIVITHRTPRGSTEMFQATPHVDLQGDCKFEVNGTPLEPWQVSKMALEAFFFFRGLSSTPSA